MKNQIIKTVLPTIFGIMAVLALLAIFNLIVHGKDVFTSPDNGFFKYFVPFATSIALIIQFFITLSYWKKFKTREKVWGMTLFRFTGFLCIFSGLVFGLVFWEPTLGIYELIMLSMTGILAFSVYWSVNILTLKQLDKRIN